MVDGFLDEAEGIDVLQLGARAEFLGAARAHRDVRIAAERSLLHVAVADAQIPHQRVHLLHVGDGFAGRAHLRLGDDLEQGRAGAIEIDPGQSGQALVQ